MGVHETLAMSTSTSLLTVLKFVPKIVMVAPSVGKLAASIEDIDGAIIYMHICIYKVCEN
jgi:hypothetical protein